MSEVLGFEEKPDSDTCQLEPEKIKCDYLRQKLRKQKLAYRDNQREIFLKKARFLGDEPKYKNFGNSDITVLAKTLKNKCEVSCELLNSVMNALIESKENIEAFLKVDGALQVLLRLISGQNEKFQLAAAQCICNLALGNEKQILQVLKAAESYLMVHLSGRNQYLKEVCAVALGNLTRQGIQNTELLMRQGFLPKVINLLDSEDPTLEASALHALTQLVYYGFDGLGLEDLESSLLAILPVFRKKSFSVAFLMSVLSSCKQIHHHFISHGIHLEALNYLLVSLKEKKKKAVCFLRIVSNLTTEESGRVATDFIGQDYTLRECVRCLLRSEKEYLNRECLSWLGNLMNHPEDAVKFYGVEVVKENFELITLYMKSHNNCSQEMAS